MLMPEESTMPSIIPRIFYTIMFNVWFDLGVYAISIILIGFGLTGMLLYSYLERQELKKED
jgi:hypothetical protein